MHMVDYIEHLDRVLSVTGENLLKSAGKNSHQQAIEKAEKEYRQYQKNTLSPVEESYLQTIKKLEKEAKKRKRISIFKSQLVPTHEAFLKSQKPFFYLKNILWEHINSKNRRRV